MVSSATQEDGGPIRGGTERSSRRSANHERAAQNNDYYLDPVVLGGLPRIWLHAKLSIPVHDLRKRYASMLTSVAAKMWLRSCEQNIEDCLASLATHMTIRLAEVLSVRLARLMSYADDLVCDQTMCLLVTSLDSESDSYG